MILAALSRFLTDVCTQRNVLRVVAAALMTLSVDTQAEDVASAQLKSVTEPGSELTVRYPLDSIKSVETANQALAAVADARAEVEVRDSELRRTCYDKFFVNSCLDAAKEQRRLAMKAIRPIDIAANAYLRRDRADERDRALAERDAKQPAGAEQKAQDQKEKTMNNAAKVKQGAEKEWAVDANTRKHMGEADKRVANHNARLRKAQQEESAKAQQRAANVAAFERKARESAERQREIAANKAAKAKDLNKKAVPSATPTEATPINGVTPPASVR